MEVVLWIICKYNGLRDECRYDYETGAKKWRRGCKCFARAMKGAHEICVVMTDRNGFAPELVERFEKLSYRYKVLFTHRNYENAPHTFYMKGEDARESVDTITRFEHVLALKRRYERFDFYRWFREIYDRASPGS